jgi:uncharacterized protein YhfF
LSSDDDITAYGAEVARCWNAFREERAAGPEPVNCRFYEAFRFGATEGSANELAALVVAGIKTATSDLLWALEQAHKPLVQVGDFSIVTDWEQRPLCVIRTTQVRIRPFEAVDERFAYDYGEGDRTLEWWKRELWTYYEQECQRIGRAATVEMPLACERFELVHHC